MDQAHTTYMHNIYTRNRGSRK